MGGDGAGLGIAELEELLDEGDFGGGGVEAAEGAPIVHHHPSPDHVRTAVDRPSRDGHLWRGKYREGRGEMAVGALFWICGGEASGAQLSDKRGRTKVQKWKWSREREAMGKEKGKKAV